MRRRTMRFGERVYFSLLPLVLLPFGAVFALMSGHELALRHGDYWILRLHFLPVCEGGGGDSLEYSMLLLAWIGSCALIMAAATISCWVMLPNSKTW